MACANRDTEVVERLLTAGTDANRGLLAGETAVGHELSRSTTRRSRLIAPELASAEWNDEERILETVRAAVDAGAGAVLHETIRAGETALHGAAL